MEVGGSLTCQPHPQEREEMTKKERERGKERVFFSVGSAGNM